MDFYIILGLERARRSTTSSARTGGWRGRYHPDINPGDRTAAAQFRQIAEAYETLSDPDRRRRYDAAGHAPRLPEAATFGFEGFDFSVERERVGGADVRRSVRRVLQQRRRRDRTARRARRAICISAIALSFEEAMRGGQRDADGDAPGALPALSGPGPAAGRGARLRCTATARRRSKSARGHMVFSKPCAQCGGPGGRRTTRCPACGGEQVEMRTEPLTIAVPAGLADGARIRVPGKGNVGPQRRRTRRSLHHRPRRAASGVPARRRRSACRRAGGDARGGARREDRGAVARRTGAAARAAGHAVGPALPAARARRPVAARRPARRSGRRGASWCCRKLLDERSKELLREFGRINAEDVRRDVEVARHVASSDGP